MKIGNNIGSHGLSGAGPGPFRAFLGPGADMDFGPL